MKFDEFLRDFQSTDEEWNRLFKQIPLKKMTQPGSSGEWSIKDVLAHLTWYEQEMVDMMRTRALAGSPLWETPLNERNALIHAQIEALPIEEVLHKNQEIHAEAWRLAQQLTEDDLNDPSYFKDMPVGDHPWQYIVSNTYEHYRDHLLDLRRVLGEGK